MIIDDADYIAHYGILRKSGRYPWGSGETQAEINEGYVAYVKDMRKQGLSDSEIARGVGIGTIDRHGEFQPSSTQLRAAESIAKAEIKAGKIHQAQKLADKGNSPTAIGRRMGVGESTVRSWLQAGEQEKAEGIHGTADFLKKQVAEKKFIDIGSGVESTLGMAPTRLNAAVSILREKGYEVWTVNVPQATTDKETKVKVLCPPGTKWSEVQNNLSDINLIFGNTEDGGRTWVKFHDPMPVDPKRVGIIYGSDGGDKADGVIYVRPGVPDLSLGKANYAQVRIKVGPDHYLKGMAIYHDDMPPGTDLLFNTNKESTGNKLDAMKPIKKDSELPFGAVIKRQIVENPGEDNERLTSAMNLVNEEGDWGKWSNSLSSQFLSKQKPSLAKAQLDRAIASREKELAEILALTNPTVKKKLLESFSDGADASAVNLKAASLAEHQAYQVILPIATMRPDQVYAPNFKDGSKVALIRYPHGGTFEIPELTVNNKHKEGIKVIGPHAQDAVGIHYSVAERMSGADFDGDFVVVVPNDHGKIKSSPALEGLKDFNTKREYPPYDGMPTIDGGTWNAKTNSVDFAPGKKPNGAAKQTQMGKVSNLITDMTIAQAPQEDIVRAIKHSMVVIDAEKHSLNWKLSEQQNGIIQLKREYQGGGNRGASTIISRAGSETSVDQRRQRYAKEGGPVDPVTGEKKFMPTGKMTTYKDGSTKPKKIKSTKLAETTDAHTLVSDGQTPIELIYADHSNAMKALANQARLAHLNTPNMKYSPSAKLAYAEEVSSLNLKLKRAIENRPLERQAQIIANATIKAKKKDNPSMSGAEKKKIANQAINDARHRVGADKSYRMVKITPEEWNAIQAGAISNNKLQDIMTNADLEIIRQYATPHHKSVVTDSVLARAKSMINNGYTKAEIAEKLGISRTTLNTALEGDGPL